MGYADSLTQGSEHISFFFSNTRVSREQPEPAIFHFSPFFLSFLFFFFFFLLAFLFIFFSFFNSLHSGRSKVTRVTVGRDVHQIFYVCKVNLAKMSFQFGSQNFDRKTLKSLIFMHENLILHLEFERPDGQQKHLPTVEAPF